MATVNANPYNVMGFISATVASNNLTVAIKDPAGNNFSAGNPMVHKIGSAPRALAGALSVTVNAGTNSFNAGSAELATKEVDYFVYLGWRAAGPAMFILISRIPYGRTYADFSSTATNEKYGAYSGAAPASTDEVVNVGRFNATLSAGAGYTWSIPATSVIVHHQIFETRWLTWMPVHTRATTPYTNTPTNNMARYLLRGPNLFYEEQHTQNATPGGSGNQRVSLPFIIAQRSAGAATNLNTVVSLWGFHEAMANYVGLFKYDGTAEATASQVYLLSGNFEY